jgi:hypothetical protein
MLALMLVVLLGTGEMEAGVSPGTPSDGLADYLYAVYAENQFIIIVMAFSLTCGFFMGQRHERTVSPMLSPEKPPSLKLVEFEKLEPLTPCESQVSVLEPHKDFEISLVDQHSLVSETSERKTSLDDKIERMLLDGKYVKSFKELTLLGQGGFGVVYKVSHRLEKQVYAVKIVAISSRFNESLETRTLFREIDAMLALQTHRVIRYVTCWLETIADKLNEL